MDAGQLLGMEGIYLVIFELVTRLIGYFLTSVGLWGVLKKTGCRPMLAFVPVVRHYQIAVAARKEEDGRNYCIFITGAYLSQLLGTLLKDGSWFDQILNIITLSIGIAGIVYAVRIYFGLFRLFQRSKWWILPWLLLECVTALIWGFGKSFQPIQEDTEDPEQAARISGSSVAKIQNGLTMNLNERTAKEFFKKKVLLRDIHLSIPSGHMVLLLGGSGAGKTTFLNAVTGYEKADAEPLLNGNDIYKSYESMKYSIGFVPQQDLMRGSDSVLMTLRDAAKLRLPKGMKRKEREARIQEVLDIFGLQSVKHNLLNKLSGGQRKRVSIALEFISDPDLFILDEPDSGLDGVVARSLFQKLREIANEGKIVIVITHTPDRVMDLFDDVIVLAKDADRTGRLAFYGSIAEAKDFFEKDNMEEILLSINQKDEGGEGRADEYVERYSEFAAKRAG